MGRESPQTGYQRYFIAIIPPPHIYDEALALKNYFREKYNSKASLNSPPHITLHMPFLWSEKKLGELTKSLTSFATGKDFIPISLSGFGAFPPRVIFISVDPNEKLNLLQRQLVGFCKTELNLFNAQYRDLPFHPHVTLAFRDLKKIRFTEAWTEFKEKGFSGSFEIDRITLLRHDGKLWHSLYDFHF